MLQQLNGCRCFDYLHLRHGARFGSSMIGPLSTLNLEREIMVHQRCPTIDGDDLTGNPASFFRAEKGHGIAHIRRRSQPPHRRPAG